jgi:hypothetical protein
VGFFEDAIRVFWEIDRGEEGVLRRVVVGIDSVLRFWGRGVGLLRWLIWFLRLGNSSGPYYAAAWTEASASAAESR